MIAATVERIAQASGARLVSADGTANGSAPADAFMRTVIDGAAAYERALIRARTKAALAAKAAKGERAGAVPYGFRVAADGVRLETNEDEQAVLVAIMSFAPLASRIVASSRSSPGAAFVSRAGKPLAQTQVAGVPEAGRMTTEPRKVRRALAKLDGLRRR